MPLTSGLVTVLVSWTSSPAIVPYELVVHTESSLGAFSFLPSPYVDAAARTDDMTGTENSRARTANHKSQRARLNILSSPGRLPKKAPKSLTGSQHNCICISTRLSLGLSFKRSRVSTIQCTRST
ncbi:hypothetical protein V8C42DRAFT_321493 [Trichoderma barbatum]